MALPRYDREYRGNAITNAITHYRGGGGRLLAHAARRRARCPRAALQRLRAECRRQRIAAEGLVVAREIYRFTHLFTHSNYGDNGRGGPGGISSFFKIGHWWRVARHGSRLGRGVRFETPTLPLSVFPTVHVPRGSCVTKLPTLSRTAVITRQLT